MYTPGPQLLLADTLSRAPDPHQPADDSRFVAVNALLHLPISDSKLREIKEATAADPDMVCVLKAIKHGWPDKSSLPAGEVVSFYPVRDALVCR